MKAAAARVTAKFPSSSSAVTTVMVVSQAIAVSVVAWLLLKQVVSVAPSALSFQPSSTRALSVQPQETLLMVASVCARSVGGGSSVKV